MSTLPKIYVAIPVLNELDYIEKTLDAINNQTYKNYEVAVCINQPDDWWDDDSKRLICLANNSTIDLLQKYDGFKIKVIDKSSEGKGWKITKRGVGWARKTVMDYVSKRAEDKDIILSLDADTVFDPFYFQSIIDNLTQHPKHVGLTVPYYHNLSGDEKVDNAMLRYEIYMRCYAINLWRIYSPYSFTALGSAIALPNWAYKKIGGITPKNSGEDFYFLQKLRKSGELLFWNPEKVYPATRESDRVIFGTGPAIINGVNYRNWSRYPIYHFSSFDKIGQFYQLLPQIYSQNIPTPVDSFLYEQQNTVTNLWDEIKNNTSSIDHFVKAVHQKFDSLRILQYLRFDKKNIQTNDEKNFSEFIHSFYPEFPITEIHEPGFCFVQAKTKTLNLIRNFLAEKEELYQINNYNNA